MNVEMSYYETVVVSIRRPRENIEKISLPLKLVSLHNYENEHHRKENLKEEAFLLGNVSISYDTDLLEIRPQINSLLKERDSTNTTENQGKEEAKTNDSQKTTNWWFLDSCSGEKFFRIDEAQEHLYYVSDICDQELYIAEQRKPADDVNSDATKAEPDGDDVSHVSTSSSSRNSQESGDYGERKENIEVSKIQMNSSHPDQIDTNVNDRTAVDTTAISTDDADIDPVDMTAVNTDAIDTTAIDATIENTNVDDSNVEETNTNHKEETTNIEEMDLITAAKMGNLEQVARLHSEGQSLMLRDHEGRSALHHAAFIGNIDVVRYLVAYAPISVLDAQDDIMFHTALHRAVTRMDKVVCSLLVSAGASLDIKDKQGYTAQELAEIMGDHVLSEYLKSVSNPVLL
ncbi:diacylglycerol kinase [Trichonephila inaurata madagascariensis]|uniref:Diacylglycerol kinase n=1 Tax=Trichonephila inaurata madagascariensis TaxID=2747483 RepID=A0A8X6XTB9_9ARAC|nr:diacylglycerol kinase [Trichonephila inaurata madagascariensis]